MIKVKGLSHERVDLQLERIERRIDLALKSSLRSVVDKLHHTHALTAASTEETPTSSVPLSTNPPLLTVSDLSTINSVWSAQVSKTILPLVAEIYHNGSSAIVESVQEAVNVSVPSVSSVYAETYLSSASNRLTRVSDTVWEEARNQLVEGTNAGESITELSSRLTGVHGLTEARAKVIARTEVLTAARAGAYDEVRTLGAQGTHEWVSTHDGRTRESHSLADGQIKPIDKPFEVGGFLLMFPGDPAGPPSETIQCRCDTVYELSEDWATGSSEVPIETPSQTPSEVPNISNENRDITKGALTERSALSSVPKYPAIADDGVSMYYGNEYKQINAAMRGVESADARTKRAIKSLQSGFSRTVTSNDIVVHRGMFYGSKSFGDDAWNRPDLTGVEWTDKAPASSTTNPAVADRFASKFTDEGVSMRIRIPKGTPAMRLSEWGDEAEVLLQPGLRYRVVKDNGTIDNVRHLDVEVIQ